MKKISFLLTCICIMHHSNAQSDINLCIKDVFKNIDSNAKKDWDPFEKWVKCVIDKPMPEFINTNLSGDTIMLSKLKGKIVIVNFWFIDCHPCIAELPGLNKLVKKYKESNIVFLAITWETKLRIKNDFLTKHKLDFTIIPEADDIIDKISGSGYPTTFIINENGIIKGAWSGGSIDEKAGDEFYDKAKAVIDDLLKAQ